MDYRYGLSKPLYLLRSNYAIALMNSNLALNGNTIRFGASGRNKTNDLVDGFKTANMSTTYSSHDCIMNSALDFLVYLFVPGKVSIAFIFGFTALRCKLVRLINTHDYLTG
ncbi:unnamed protein product [Fusarium graminearum]|nr:unnamed protein product [Fusarium graminearum]